MDNKDWVASGSATLKEGFSDADALRRLDYLTNFRRLDREVALGVVLDESRQFDGDRSAV